jgi:hypothetical protein
MQELAMKGAIVRGFVATALLLLVAGCASAGAERDGRSDRITREQLAEMPSFTAYEVVQRFHPTWLRARGSTSFGGGPAPVIVYVDQVRAGGVNELRNLRASEIEEIRYLDASDATLRFGTDHGGGAILVETRRG